MPNVNPKNEVTEMTIFLLIFISLMLIMIFIAQCEEMGMREGPFWLCVLMLLFSAVIYGVYYAATETDILYILYNLFADWA